MKKRAPPPDLEGLRQQLNDQLLQGNKAHEVEKLRAVNAELLEALSEIVAAFENQGWSMDTAWANKARAAIAKAK